MKQFLVSLTVSALVLGACSDSKVKNTGTDDKTTSETTTTTTETTTPAVKKYPLKSGIITYETTIDPGGMNLKSKKILYFDDYGMKEAEETLNPDGTVKETFLSDGKDLILLIHESKEAYNRGKAYRGVALKVDYNEFSSADKESGKVKKVADMTVAGKPCEAFEMKDDNTKTVTTFAGWNNIMLALKQTGTMNSTTEAVKVEENANVPAEKFQVPAGYTQKTM